MGSLNPISQPMVLLFSNFAKLPFPVAVSYWFPVRQILFSLLQKCAVRFYTVDIHIILDSAAAKSAV